MLLGLLVACASSDTRSDVGDSDDVEDADISALTDVGAMDRDTEAADTDDAADDAAEEDAPQADTSALDVSSDASPDTADTRECRVARECDDLDDCTIETCVAGVCGYTLIDADNDGSPDSTCGGSDCADLDSTIGAGSTRACASACGATGVEMCADGVWTACDAPTDCACTPGAVDSVPCALCGTATRTCGDDGQWSELSACGDQGVCEPGTQQAVSCGELDCTSPVAGSQMDTCTVACVWSAGACVGAPECCPGATESNACGACGSSGRTCDASGQWSDWSSCLEPECCPGEAESRGCSGGCDGDSQSRACVDGAWSGWSLCEVPECCAGQIDVTPCNDCGSQTRTCGLDNTWGRRGLCTNRGLTRECPRFEACDPNGYCGCDEGPCP